MRFNQMFLSVMTVIHFGQKTIVYGEVISQNIHIFVVLIVCRINIIIYCFRFLAYNVAFLNLKDSPELEQEDDSFLHIDSNNDKLITRAEMTEYLAKMESSKEGDYPSDPEEVS